MKDATIERVDELIEHLCGVIKEIDCHEDKIELTKAVSQLISARKNSN